MGEQESHQCCGSCNDPKAPDNPNSKKEIIKLGVALCLFLLGLVFYKQLHESPYSWAEFFVLLTAYFLSGFNVLSTAFKNLCKGKIFDENFLMAIATMGAIAIHEVPEAVGVMIFYKIGELFQEAAVNKSRRSIIALLEIRPDFANVTLNGNVTKVASQEVKVDQEIIVKPGERIPLDGIITNGISAVDTSAMTGESVPRDVKPGDQVLSGTVNQDGVLTIKVTKIFSESSISKILHMVEEAGNKKSQTEKFITQFASYYTPVVVIVAALIACLPPLIFHEPFSLWFYRALVMLVISCPCALVISIPLGYFGGVGWASRKGILVKGSTYLDVLTKVTKIVLDKTGTLTKGVFKVIEIKTYNDFTGEDVLKFAAFAEAQSNHPLAKAVQNAYGKVINSSTIEKVQEIAGHGIKARVNGKNITIGNDRLLHVENIEHPVCKVPGTVLHVAQDSTYMGYIVVGDELKEDSVQALKYLRNLGVKEIVMLTGDNDFSARAIAEKLNLDSFYADLMPQDKVMRFEEVMRRSSKGEKTAFIGDGINDAPTIARADVGIAMGGLGSDAAIETADVVIMTDSLMKVGAAIEIATYTRKIVWQNISLALGVKAIFLILGAFGIATMWEAIFADVGVALLAILNAVSAKRYKLQYK
jgi:Cd2+/Zn2+-exporting ATPase